MFNNNFIRLALAVLLLQTAALACSLTSITVNCTVADLIDAINSAKANSDTTRLILNSNCSYQFTNKDNHEDGQSPARLGTRGVCVCEAFVYA